VSAPLPSPQHHRWTPRLFLLAIDQEATCVCGARARCRDRKHEFWIDGAWVKAAKAPVSRCAREIVRVVHTPRVQPAPDAPDAPVTPSLDRLDAYWARRDALTAARQGEGAESRSELARLALARRSE